MKELFNLRAHGWFWNPPCLRLSGISKGTFEIPHNISYLYIVRCVFYSEINNERALQFKSPWVVLKPSLSAIMFLFMGCWCWVDLQPLILLMWKTSSEADPAPLQTGTHFIKVDFRSERDSLNDLTLRNFTACTTLSMLYKHCEKLCTPNQPKLAYLQCLKLMVAQSLLWPKIGLDHLNLTLSK